MFNQQWTPNRNANKKKIRDWKRQVHTLNFTFDTLVTICGFSAVLYYPWRARNKFCALIIVILIVCILRSFYDFIYAILSRRVFVVTQSTCIQSTTIRKIVIIISTIRLWHSSVSWACNFHLIGMHKSERISLSTSFCKIRFVTKQSIQSILMRSIWVVCPFHYAPMADRLIDFVTLHFSRFRKIHRPGLFHMAVARFDTINYNVFVTARIRRVNLYFIIVFVHL